MMINNDLAPVLASGSPRRIEMLTTCGLKPQVIPSAFAEVLPLPLLPHEQAMYFALGKAMDVAHKLAEESRNIPFGHTDPATDPFVPSLAPLVPAPDSQVLSPALIIGCDTIVVFDGKVMEKPKDKADGMTMLMALSGQTHQVISGVCLAGSVLNKQGNRVPLTKCFYEESHVTFATYSREEMDAYLDTDEAYDKAGGYAIQGTFQKYITSFTGDRNNIIGFPLARFLKEIKEFG